MICTQALTSIMLMFQGLKSTEDDSRNNPTNPTMPASVNKGSKTVASVKVPVCVYVNTYVRLKHDVQFANACSYVHARNNRNLHSNSTAPESCLFGCKMRGSYRDCIVPSRAP